MRIRQLALALFILSGVAATLALTHMNNLAAFIVIGPGYAVQAWLFETHRALGGLGYAATMVGVSALVWTLIALSLVVVVRRVRWLVRRRQASSSGA
jgi:uncharacterized membrane protein